MNIFKKLFGCRNAVALEEKPTKEQQAKFDRELAALKKWGEDAINQINLNDYELVKAINLKVGDKIIHDYSEFIITECGCGFGAGNKFGHYFWIKGNFIDGNPTDPHPLKDFWSFQGCPMIKLNDKS